MIILGPFYGLIVVLEPSLTSTPCIESLSPCIESPSDTLVLKVLLTRVFMRRVLLSLSNNDVIPLS